MASNEANNIFFLEGESPTLNETNMSLELNSILKLTFVKHGDLHSVVWIVSLKCLDKLNRTLCSLVLFRQFWKREKHPLEECYF